MTIDLLNSGTQLMPITIGAYATSGSALEQERWGQPPLAEYYLVTIGEHFVGYEIMGPYARHERHRWDLQSRIEFESWERAGFEAWDIIEREPE